MCTKKESFVYSNVNCQMRVCNQCYKTFPEDSITIIIPKSEDIDELNVHIDDVVDDSSNESQNEDNFHYLMMMIH